MHYFGHILKVQDFLVCSAMALKASRLGRFASTALDMKHSCKAPVYVDLQSNVNTMAVF